MTKLETCLKDRSLDSEGDITYKYALHNLNTKLKNTNNNDKTVINIIKEERDNLLNKNFEEIETSKGKCNQYTNSINKKRYCISKVNKGKLQGIKLEMIETDLKKYEEKTNEIMENIQNNDKIKLELQDKLFKINEMIKSKEEHLTKTNDDLEANKGLVSKNEKENKLILTFNIIFFCIIVIILLYINLSSNTKFKTKRRISNIKDSFVTNKKERLFNSNNNSKKTENLFNNENKKIQKKVLGLDKKN